MRKKACALRCISDDVRCEVNFNWSGVSCIGVASDRDRRKKAIKREIEWKRIGRRFDCWRDDEEEGWLVIRRESRRVTVQDGTNL